VRKYLYLSAQVVTQTCGLADYRIFIATNVFAACMLTLYCHNRYCSAIIYLSLIMHAASVANQSVSRATNRAYRIRFAIATN